MIADALATCKVLGLCQPHKRQASSPLKVYQTVATSATVLQKAVGALNVISTASETLFWLLQLHQAHQ